MGISGSWCRIYLSRLSSWPRPLGTLGRYPFLFFLHLPHDPSVGPYWFYCFSSGDLRLEPCAAFVLFSLPAGLLCTLHFVYQLRNDDWEFIQSPWNAGAS